MNDNFDLKAYLGSKRLLTENYENMSEEKTGTAEDVIAKFKAMDLRDPDLDLTDISNEATELPAEEFTKFIELGTQEGIIDSDDDGWDWLIQGHFPNTDTEEYNEIEYGSEEEGTYPWSKKEDNYPDVNISDEVPFSMDEPEDEESIAEEAAPDLEAELMSKLDESEELNEITPEAAIGLIPAAAFAVTIGSLISSGVMTALENGSMGDKGKQFAAKLKSLGSKSTPKEALN